MCREKKNPDGWVANSVDPDQTPQSVWSRSTLFDQACLPEYLGYNVLKHARHWTRIPLLYKITDSQASIFSYLY